MFLFKTLKGLRTKIMRIGVHSQLDAASIRKLYIFNQLNFLGFLTGVFLPLAALLSDGYLPVIAWVVACSPAFISLGVLILNYKKRYQLAMLIYFTLYPLTTALVYAGSP